AVVGSGSELYVSFSLPVARDTTLPAEVITIELLCSNRRLPTQLRVGDISVPTAATPPIVTFKNLTTPTLPVEPPLGGDLHWRLLAHLNLSYRTLAGAEALRAVPHLSNFQALVDRQAARANQIRLQGIKRWQTHPTDRLLRGAAIRGVRFEAELDEDAFADEGELYLFAALLNEVLAAQTSLNTFTELVVTAAQARNRYEFAPPRGPVAMGGTREPPPPRRRAVTSSKRATHSRCSRPSASWSGWAGPGWGARARRATRWCGCGRRCR